MTTQRLKDFRIIARLDIKNEHVIKGIHLEGLRKVGNPGELAIKYYEAGADELLFMDAVASLYDRNNIFHIIEKAAEQVFIPLTIGGGIRSLEDVKSSLVSGADKIAFNTAIIKNPRLIEEVAYRYGSQCCVCSIEAKKISPNRWEAYVDNGREPSGRDVLEWVKEVTERGAGEILITSIDQEGTKKGFDIDLYREIRPKTKLPIIASGGAGSISDIQKLKSSLSVDGVAIASVLHYNTTNIQQIKAQLLNDLNT
jgi:cyclase